MPSSVVASPYILNHFIHGRAVAPSTDSYLDKLDPRTGEVIARVASNSAAAVSSSGSASRPAGPLPDVKLAKNMMVVVQPNVITKDQRAGVQTGELMLITETGCESLHTFPRGFIEIA